jgi:SepF-like predicted cell division protein (DUF552 family)
MNILDIQLKLHSNLPILIDDVGRLHSLTLRDIAEIGLHKYNQYLSALCFDLNDLQTQIEDEDITVFDVIALNSLHDEQFKKIVTEALSLMFKEVVTFSENYGIFFVGEKNECRIISSINYEYIKDLIKIQNGLKSIDGEDEYNPKDAKAKEIIEKLKHAKQKIKKQRLDDDEEPLNLFDLISILCANGNGINIFNVYDLNMFQFNDQFNRMKMLDEYKINIQSLLAGADSDKIELRHWMSKI